jgi:hypothetical protein
MSDDDERRQLLECTVGKAPSFVLSADREELRLTGRQVVSSKTIVVATKKSQIGFWVFMYKLLS